MSASIERRKADPENLYYDLLSIAHIISSIRKEDFNEDIGEFLSFEIQERTEQLYQFAFKRGIKPC